MEDGATCYTTQKLSDTDANLDSVTVNGTPVLDPTAGFTLPGNTAVTYVVTATDKGGNTTTVTVTMLPISELTDPMTGLDETNVNSDDWLGLEAIVDTATELLVPTVTMALSLAALVFLLASKRRKTV